jgi:hypothetical protein
MIETWFDVCDFGWDNLTRFENEIIEWAKIEWGNESEVIFDRVAKSVLVRSGELEKCINKTQNNV